VLDFKSPSTISTSRNPYLFKVLSYTDVSMVAVHSSFVENVGKIHSITNAQIKNTDKLKGAGELTTSP
jgi:hypothetical protein